MPQIVSVEGRTRQTDTFGRLVIINEPLNLEPNYKCLFTFRNCSQPFDANLVTRTALVLSEQKNCRARLLQWRVILGWHGPDCSANRNRHRLRQQRRRMKGYDQIANPLPGKQKKNHLRPKLGEGAIQANKPQKRLLVELNPVELCKNKEKQYFSRFTVCGDALVVVVMSVCPSASTPCWIKNVPPLV